MSHEINYTREQLRAAYREAVSFGCANAEELRHKHKGMAILQEFDRLAEAYAAAHAKNATPLKEQLTSTEFIYRAYAGEGFGVVDTSQGSMDEPHGVVGVDLSKGE
jgi:hypothetical protein